MSSMARQEGDACEQPQLCWFSHSLRALETWLQVTDKTPGVSETGS